MSVCVMGMEEAELHDGGRLKDIRAFGRTEIEDEPIFGVLLNLRAKPIHSPKARLVVTITEVRS
jgi:hypothetical protein